MSQGLARFWVFLGEGEMGLGVVVVLVVVLVWFFFPPSWLALHAYDVKLYYTLFCTENQENLMYNCAKDVQTTQNVELFPEIANA